MNDASAEELRGGITEIAGNRPPALNLRGGEARAERGGRWCETARGGNSSRGKSGDLRSPGRSAPTTMRVVYVGDTAPSHQPGSGFVSFSCARSSSVSFRVVFPSLARLGHPSWHPSCLAPPFLLACFLVGISYSSCSWLELASSSGYKRSPTVSEPTASAPAHRGTRGFCRAQADREGVSVQL